MSACPPVTRSQAQPPVPRLRLLRISKEKVLAAQSALAYRRETGNFLRYYNPITASPSSPSTDQTADPTDESSGEDEEVESKAMREKTQCKRKKGKKAKSKGHKSRSKHKKRRREETSEKEAVSQNQAINDETREESVTRRRRDPEIPSLAQTDADKDQSQQKQSFSRSSCSQTQDSSAIPSISSNAKDLISVSKDPADDLVDQIPIFKQLQKYKSPKKSAAKSKARIKGHVKRSKGPKSRISHKKKLNASTKALRDVQQEIRGLKEMVIQAIRPQVTPASAIMQSLTENPPEYFADQLRDLMSWPKEVEELRQELKDKMEKALKKLHQLQDKKLKVVKKQETKQPVVKQEPNSGSGDCEWNYVDDGDVSSCLMLCMKCYEKVAVMECPCLRVKYCSQSCYYADVTRHQKEHVGLSLSDPIFPDLEIVEDTPQAMETDVAGNVDTGTNGHLGVDANETTAPTARTDLPDENRDEDMDEDPAPQVQPPVEAPSHEVHELDDSEDDAEPEVPEEPIASTSTRSRIRVLSFASKYAPEDLEFEWQEKVKLEKEQSAAAESVTRPPLQIACPKRFKKEKGIDETPPVVPATPLTIYIDEPEPEPGPEVVDLGVDDDDDVIDVADII